MRGNIAGTISAAVRVCAALCLVAGVSAAQEPVAGPAQAVTARVTLSPPVVPFHHQAKLSIVVDAPAGVDVTVPDVRDLIGDLKVAGTPEHQKAPVDKNSELVRTVETYTLDPVNIRDYYFRPLELTWGDGGRLVVPMPVFRVRDLTPSELEQAARFEAALPGGPGVDTGVRRPWWFWAAIAGGVIVLALIGLAVARFRRPAPVVTMPKTPWDLAKERLALLEARHLPQQGKHDAYYVDLSAILRYYIEARFALHAPERTTPEFMAETIGKGYFTPEQEVFLSRFLRLGDRVKFARFRPDLEEMARSFEEVSTFVEDTIPRAEESAPQPEAAAA